MRPDPHENHMVLPELDLEAERLKREYREEEEREMRRIENDED